jgi:hypothetical protein
MRTGTEVHSPLATTPRQSSPRQGSNIMFIRECDNEDQRRVRRYLLHSPYALELLGYRVCRIGQAFLVVDDTLIFGSESEKNNERGNRTTGSKTTYRVWSFSSTLSDASTLRWCTLAVSAACWIESISRCSESLTLVLSLKAVRDRKSLEVGSRRTRGGK